MIKQFLLTLGILGALACGGVNEDFFDDGAGDEIGQVEQEIIVGTNGSGFRSASDHLHCETPGGSGSQSCFIPQLPPSLQIGYCFSSGWDATDKANIKAGVVAVDGQVSSAYAFNETSFPCTLSFQSAVAFTSNTGAVMENYMRFSPGGTTVTLTSPAGAGHVNGAWKSFTLGVVSVDTAKLTANFAAGLARNNVTFHMGSQAAALMLGDGTSSTNTSYTRRSLNTGLFSGLTPGEVCRANVLNGNVNQTQVSAVSACVP